MENLLCYCYEFADFCCRKSFQNVNRWFVTIVNQPQVKAVLGEVKLADKPPTYDQPKAKQGKKIIEQFFLA